MDYKEIFLKEARRFTEETGISVGYWHQRKGATYLFIDQTKDGSLAYEVSGYKEALTIMDGMTMMYDIMKRKGA